ncbi:flp pilus-assembly TadE/G-like family protein [Nocardioides sp. LHD-245]|uniref:Rv3654c family TadE-like protein n=1 Tax=Nocardioides sp. LHD-245 TaxID=3051387 RepID=UPI0027DFC88D|nr:flp pilus-assembly TadE/G-like family protein [Nocardioides sp. LHD-245]
MTARDQRGAATVLTLAMVGVLLLVGAAAGVVGAIVVAQRRAQAAADLAALAAATSLAGRADHPGRDPCASAAEVAGDNGAELDSCRVEGRDVVVAVRVGGPRWLGQDQDLVAAARAGPATLPP